LRIHHDDFAVHDDLIERQRFDRARDFGKDGSVVVAVPGEQERFATRLAGEQPVSVELELEQPAIARERPVARLGEHDVDGFRVDSTTRCAGLLDRSAKIGGRAASGLHFFDGQPGEHRRLDELIARRLHEGVALFDQEPVALALLDLHERPLAVQLVAAQLEQQLAFLESLAPILERDPFTAVPDDDSAGAVVPARNLPLEVAVLEWVVLDVHGEPFVVRVVRRTLGHGPRPQHAAHLEPQIEVQIPRGVLVNDEQSPGHGRHRAHRLGRRVDRTFSAVFGEAVVHGRES
jgi:hypothetical protein